MSKEYNLKLKVYSIIFVAGLVSLILGAILGASFLLFDLSFKSSLLVSLAIILGFILIFVITEPVTLDLLINKKEEGELLNLYNKIKEERKYLAPIWLTGKVFGRKDNAFNLIKILLIAFFIFGNFLTVGFSFIMSFSPLYELDPSDFFYSIVIFSIAIIFSIIVLFWALKREIEVILDYPKEVKEMIEFLKKIYGGGMNE